MNDYSYRLIANGVHVAKMCLSDTFQEAFQKAVKTALPTRRFRLFFTAVAAGVSAAVTVSTTRRRCLLQRRRRCCFRHLPPLGWALGFPPPPPTAVVLGARGSAVALIVDVAIAVRRRRRINFKLPPYNSTRRIIHGGPLRLLWGLLGEDMAYVNGRKVEPVEGSMAWDTWFLEDNQEKAWIVNSVSSDIQPLILRKKTARDMWVILEHMYGQKKRKVCVYQLMRDVYSLRQETRSVADFYAALKSKVFLFLSGLNDDFENIRSQILNSDESFSIEDVYARVEAEEQRKLVSSDRKGEEQSAFVSRASVGSSRSSRKCTHCKKLGHTVDFCWDLHPEKKNGRGKPSSSKQPVSSATDHGDRKASFSAEQIRELRAYLSQVDGETPHVQVLDKDEEGISTEAHEQEKKEEEVSPMVTEQEGTRMFGQVYSRRKTCADKVVDNEEATLNPNPASSLDDPSSKVLPGT
ncbi:hypothetical protein EJ110_NYTH21831 [Nymphaea thermarum]|nr:hypothetical protein EJ110_NYTH21831 [Nymphaea thermarum]